MKASVVIPAYNSEGSIARCLTALIDQTFATDDYEIIVVDDGSTDGSDAIIKSYPVRYIWQENAGPASARNRGANEATGGVILFTDADCVPAPDWVEKSVAPFLADARVSAAKGVYSGTLQNSLTARFCQVEFEERFELLKRAETIDMIDTYSATFRRDIFIEAGGFDESFPVANNEDTDLSYRLAAAGHRLVFNPLAKVKHLGHPDSVARYASVKFWRGYWRMVVYKKYPEKMVKDTYTPQTLKAQVATLFGAMALMMTGIVFPPLFLLALLSFCAFLFFSVPFALFAIKRDFTIGLLSPFFLALRALVIGSGVLYFAVARSHRV